MQVRRVVVGAAAAAAVVLGSAGVAHAGTILGVIANDDAATTSINTAVVIDVLANDINNFEGGDLIFQDLSQGAHGTVELIGGSLKYTPAAGFSGTDTFEYATCVDFGEPVGLAETQIQLDQIEQEPQFCDTALVTVTIPPPPTTTTTVAPTTTTTVAPTTTTTVLATVQSVAPTTVAAVAELPVTGSSSDGPLGVFGLLALAAGFSLLGFAGRRRQARGRI